MSETPIRPLRARMIEHVSVRNDKTQNDYIRHVKTFSTLLVPSPLDLLKPFSSKTDT